MDKATNEAESLAYRHQRSQTFAGWVSAVSAFVTIPLSLIALYQSHEAQISARHEDVLVSVSAYRGDYPTTFRDLGGGSTLPGTVSTLWKVLVANNGDLPVSLVSHQVLTAESRGLIFYSGLDQGLLDQHLQPRQLPINLAPGTSEQLFLRLGSLVAPSAYSEIRKLALSKKSFSFSELNNSLALRKMDFYGNKVRPMLERGRLVGFSVETVPQKHQQFLITFRTARGLRITSSASYYSFIGEL